MCFLLLMLIYLLIEQGAFEKKRQKSDTSGNSQGFESTSGPYWPCPQWGAWCPRWQGDFPAPQLSQCSQPPGAPRSCSTLAGAEHWPRAHDIPHSHSVISCLSPYSGWYCLEESQAAVSSKIFSNQNVCSTTYIECPQENTVQALGRKAKVLWKASAGIR